MKEAGPRSDDAESAEARSGTEFVGMVPTRSDSTTGQLLGSCLFAVTAPDA